MASERFPLSVMDAMPFALTFNYFFPREIDLSRLKQALESLLLNEFWLLRGSLSGLSALVPPSLSPEETEKETKRSYWEETERLDLEKEDLLKDCRLVAHLNLSVLSQGDRLCIFRATVLKDCVAMGVNISHSVCDSHSFFRLFWPALAARYREGPSASVPQISFDRAPFQPPEEGSNKEEEVVDLDLSKEYFMMNDASKMPSMPPPLQLPESMAESIVGCVSFSSDFLVRLKKQMNAHSRHQALFAALWKATGIKGVCFPINIRENETRWCPSIPYNYMGNPLFFGGAVVEDPSSHSLSDLTQRIHQGLKESDPERNQKRLRYLWGNVKEGMMVVGEMNDRLMVSDWTHMDWKGDFGDGCFPELLFSTSFFPPSLIVTGDGPDGGIDLYCAKSIQPAITNILEMLTL